MFIKCMSVQSLNTGANVWSTVYICCYRYHKIGLLVLLLHDPADVLLELAKCNVYFKFQKIADIVFALFIYTW